jgi:DUF917 family protein
MKQISADDIEALPVGAWILGSGGGDNTYHGLLNLRRLYRDGARASHRDRDFVAQVLARAGSMIEEHVDRVKTEAGDGNAIRVRVKVARNIG